MGLGGSAGSSFTSRISFTSKDAEFIVVLGGSPDPEATGSSRVEILDSFNVYSMKISLIF